ncbi:cytochrome P450 [Ilyonectria sp. MPI-CAGE-AT-0026]|nr:cytochrome P450 [Ilyonectria sp. MPI-CAGE-AT-0026]
MYLHPLRGYPGPKLYAAAIIPIYYQRLRGFGPQFTTELHKKYGPVVRIAPNQISYTDNQAWKEIYGHHPAGNGTWRKDPAQAGPEEAGTPGILRSEGQAHSQLKRTFNHAFSDEALKEQEGLICGYAKQLVSVLQHRAELPKADPNDAEGQVDMVKMYNFATFDIMADLVFGEDLGLLENTTYTPWVYAMIGHLKSVSIMHAIARWQLLTAVMKRLLPKFIKEMREAHFNFCVQRVDKRMATKTERPDFWSLVIKAGTHRDISKGQLYATMSDFMFAGTETTATILSGITYYLCKNPESMATLVAEIRQFKNPEDLNLNNLQALPFLQACINEAFRLYPPVPVGNMRLAPLGGAIVCGRFVPEGTTVQYTQYAAYHTEHNFKNPELFVPKRWLPTPPEEYTSDKTEVVNPFGVGPRACIGKNSQCEAEDLPKCLAWHSTNFECFWHMCSGTLT